MQRNVTVVALSYEKVCDDAVCGTKSMRGHVMVLSMVPPYATAWSLIMLSRVPSYAKSCNGTIRGTKSMQSQLMLLSMVPKLSQWSLTEQSFHSVVHGTWWDGMISIFFTHTNRMSDLSWPITQKRCQFRAHFQMSTSLQKKWVWKVNQAAAP